MKIGFVSQFRPFCTAAGSPGTDFRQNEQNKRNYSGSILSVLSKRYVKEPATWNVASVVNLRPENQDYGEASRTHTRDAGPPCEDFSKRVGKKMVRHYL